MHRPNLAGQRFDKGVVIELIKDGKIKVQNWGVRCDCGNFHGRLWDELKRNALKRGIEFNITREYLWGLYIKQKRKCAISRLDIEFARFNKEAQYDRTNTASLDRIDNNKGYVVGNVQWLHKDINRMKWAHTQEMFFNYCRLVVENNNGHF